ncbi:MAG: class I SAM-dependent methyltransferase [Acidobacteria bacterium]|nr:class I SAM-dependent methyltransferase [Acidobacteriota bacterium]
MSARHEVKGGEEAALTEGGIPTAWGQAYPRSVLLAPDGLLVPYGTLRTLLKKSGRLEVIVRGFALGPWIGDGERVVIDSRRPPRPGDLALCEADRWGDVRRLLARRRDGGWITGLDPVPGARETLPPERVLAVVAAGPGAGGATGRVLALAYPAWTRVAAVIYWIRKAVEAPDFAAGAAASVQAKYADQVEIYTGMLGFPLGHNLQTLLSRTFPIGGSVLVAGSGAGGEVIHLARQGYRVTAFDVLPEMVRAAGRNAEAAGVAAEFLQADMAELDLRGRTFDGIYVTPLVYSFVPGKARRVRSLYRLGRHLARGGSAVFSAHLLTSASHFLQAALAWMRHAPRRRGHEFGDWFTWFLRSDGTIDKSYSHWFTVASVLAEARQAGFRACRKDGAYFVAADFAG